MLLYFTLRFSKIASGRRSINIFFQDRFLGKTFSLQIIDGRIWIELTLATLVVDCLRGFVRSRIFLFIIWEFIKIGVKKYGYR